jgi:hypothetical protein
VVFGVPMKIISTCRNGLNGCRLVGVFEAKRETRADEQQRRPKDPRANQVES